MLDSQGRTGSDGTHSAPPGPSTLPPTQTDACTIVADLHAHSTCSDGKFPAEDVLDHALECGLSAFALTDHDTFSGARRARQRLDARIADDPSCASMLLVPGLEISAQTEGKDVHLLVYWARDDDKRLDAMLREAQEGRDARTRACIELLDANGYRVSEEQVTSGGRRLNRTNIARQLVSQGDVPSIAWAFDNLMQPGCPCFVEHHDVDTCEAIELAVQAGGVPVVAHPAHYHVVDKIPMFVEAGLRGIEVYHPEQTDEQSAHLLEMAHRFGVLVTGGSDWHGDSVHKAKLGESGLTASRLEEFLAAQPHDN